MSVMASFKEFCQTLLLYYDVDLISDEDFIILYQRFSSPKVKSLTFFATLTPLDSRHRWQDDVAYPRYVMHNRSRPSLNRSSTAASR